MATPNENDKDTKSLALDFVEQRLGQFYAAENWKKLGPAGPVWIRRWLVASGYSPDLAPVVVTELQALFDRGVGWPIGFER